jgi:hypothetical protein
MRYRFVIDLATLLVIFIQRKIPIKFILIGTFFRNKMYDF